MGHRLALAHIERALSIIDPVFLATPQYHVESLDAVLGCRLVAKIETVNPVRSFKGRGASLYLADVPAGSELVCASAGNFGQALAYASRSRSVRLIVYASEHANPLKVERMNAWTVDTGLCGANPGPRDRTGLEGKGASMNARRVVGALLAGLTVVLLLAGCDRDATATLELTPSPTPSSAASSSMRAMSPGPGVGRTSVSLGIYSGRPDPAWTLTDAQAAELFFRIGRLPATVGTPPQGGLGYHGFSVMTAREERAQPELVVFRGTVARPGVGEQTDQQDAGRSVERFLLDTARPFLTATEIAVVESDLGAP